jgi:hypothetical protein
MPGPHLKWRDATIRQMAAEGHTIISASKALGVWKDSLRDYARKHAITFAASPIGRPKKTAPSERDIQIADMYAAGMTHAEVAGEFGITASRAQQIATRAGIDGKRGGNGKRAQDRKAAAEAERDARYMRKWGVPYAEYLSLRSAGLILAYIRQRRNAALRGIEWHFNVATWFAVWDGSGLLHLRGRRKGNYVMSRFGDVGPYAPSNACIKLAAENVSEARTHKTFARPRSKSVSMGAI